MAKTPSPGMKPTVKRPGFYHPHGPLFGKRPSPGGMTPSPIKRPIGGNNG